MEALNSCFLSSALRLPAALFVLEDRKQKKDYHRSHSRHKELMACQYPWQQH